MRDWHRTRYPLIAALVVAVAAAIAAWVATGGTGAPAPIPVKVRWTGNVTAADRGLLESRFHLTNPDFDAGTTWRYRLDDASTANIRALVTHPAVEDTANLDRATYRPAGTLDPRRVRLVSALEAGAAGGFVVLFGWLAAGGLASARRQRIQAGTDGARARETAVHALLTQTSRNPRIELTAALLAIPVVASICRAMWRTPFPISETVGILEDVQLSPHSFFDPTVRSWYRPLYFSTWRLFWEGSGSLKTALTLFRALEVACVVALFILFLRCLRPRTWLDAGAAAVALAILAGAQGFRDNLELPLLMTLVAMPLALVLWRLTEAPARWWHAPAMVAIVMVAVGYKEQGLVLVPLIVMAWLTGAPGVTKWTALATTAVTLAYLGLRFSTRGTWQPFEQAVGLGFHILSASEANARFGAAPLAMYAYNAAATLASILFSEPTTGEFRFTRDLLEGVAAPWQFNHVLSSLALTTLLAWWSWGTLRRSRGRAWTLEGRLVVTVGVTLAASAALGFNYSRDRLGGMALVFLALAGYHAVRRAAAVTAAESGPRALVLTCLLGLFAATWQLRALGTVEYVRYASERTQREWLTAPFARRASGTQGPAYISLIQRMTAQGTDPAAAVRHSYPKAVMPWMGER